MGLLKGLNVFGLDKLENISIYEQKKETIVEKEVSKKKLEDYKDEDLIFDKTYQCPCCNNTVKAKMVRAGKSIAKETEMDLRTTFRNIDIHKYGVASCSICGYTAMHGAFLFLTFRQGKLIQEKISNDYHCDESIRDATSYTYPQAISLHQLALINAIIKKSKASEKAIIALKTAWLFRGQQEELQVKSPNDHTKLKELQEKECEFLKVAFQGFYQAREKESFPVCGMNEPTLDYLLAVLGYKTNQKKDCLKLLANVLTSKIANAKLKNNALLLKETIKTEKTDN